MNVSVKIEQTHTYLSLIDWQSFFLGVIATIIFDTIFILFTKRRGTPKHMKRKNKQVPTLLQIIVTYLFFGAIIVYSWQWYEKVTYGEIKPDAFDSLIGVVLALSLTLNVSLIKILKR